MTRLYNDRFTFVNDMVEGLVAARGDLLRQVVGGVVVANPSARPQVAVVLAGPGGHYPATTGLVGPGMASGAAVGDLFALPTLNHIVSVAQNANQGLGVLLCYPNAAHHSDVYDQVAQALAELGISCRTVAVTDDLGTPHAGTKDRRGSSGLFAVAKIAGAAAAQGRPLAEVTLAAVKANDRTLSLSVLFAGCTLPGEESPIFNVRAGRMRIGLGPHGEPGTDELDIPTADGLAELLLRELLTASPAPHSAEGRAGVVFSGLGCTTQEELFVVYRRISQLFLDAEIIATQPVVGDIQTSLDTAGASLAITWLDEELADLWAAPADTPAFRRDRKSPTSSSSQRQRPFRFRGPFPRLQDRALLSSVLAQD